MTENPEDNAAIPDVPDVTTEAEASAKGVEAEWGVLDNPMVAEVLANVAARVGAQYKDVTTADDQSQEGAMLLALNHDLVNTCLADDLMGQRTLYKWLHSRLVDAVRPTAARASRSLPLDNVLEYGDS